MKDHKIQTLLSDRTSRLLPNSHLKNLVLEGVISNMRRLFGKYHPWLGKVSALNLVENLVGSAKVAVSNLQADDDYEPTVDAIFHA